MRNTPLFLKSVSVDLDSRVISSSSDSSPRFPPWPHCVSFFCICGSWADLSGPPHSLSRGLRCRSPADLSRDSPQSASRVTPVRLPPPHSLQGPSGYFDGGHMRLPLLGTILNLESKGLVSWVQLTVRSPLRSPPEKDRQFRCLGVVRNDRPCGQSNHVAHLLAFIILAGVTASPLNSLRRCGFRARGAWPASARQRSCLLRVLVSTCLERCIPGVSTWFNSPVFSKQKPFSSLLA